VCWLNAIAIDRRPLRGQGIITAALAIVGDRYLAKGSSLRRLL